MSPELFIPLAIAYYVVSWLLNSRKKQRQVEEEAMRRREAEEALEASGRTGRDGAPATGSAEGPETVGAEGGKPRDPGREMLEKIAKDLGLYIPEDALPGRRNRTEGAGAEPGDDWSGAPSGTGTPSGERRIPAERVPGERVPPRAPERRVPPPASDRREPSRAPERGGMERPAERREPRREDFREPRRDKRGPQNPDPERDRVSGEEASRERLREERRLAREREKRAVELRRSEKMQAERRSTEARQTERRESEERYAESRRGRMPEPKTGRPSELHPRGGATPSSLPWEEATGIGKGLRDRDRFHPAALRTFLRQPKSLQEALVLKTLLDPPVALRNRSGSPGFTRSGPPRPEPRKPAPPAP